MKLKVLGSSSAGNCYILESETECLVLEAGLPFLDVKKAIDFKVDKIVGVVASHLHKDHFGYAEEYLKSGIPVLASEETHKSIKSYHDQVIVRKGYWYQLGGFNITPFELNHDVECYGFIIRHDNIGTLLFATDTGYIKQNFKSLKLNHILVECNYSDEIVNGYLEDGAIDGARVNRTMRTHMELETTKEFIRANKTPSLYNVCLLHLSDGNSHAERFEDEVKGIVDWDVDVFIADKGLEFQLNLTPF